MLNRRFWLGGAGALLAEALISEARAQTNPAVFEHDLPDVEMKNWAVTVREINYQPGGTSAPHRHPGITIVYVLEGEIRSKVGDGPEKTYGPGQMFMETPGQLHAVSRNASDSKPAKFIAILMAEKGKPLSAPA
ncbi:MAG TPA: cupin domain-containing protein [Bryobacteraceae bacterium]|jgi:quercetin dioxygenase-like cupin family protein|nr:cupin domain-containing protein [Bryobacteraceae bacterium]